MSQQYNEAARSLGTKVRVVLRFGLAVGGAGLQGVYQNQAAPFDRGWL
jgi:hypothetical protein